MSDVTNETETLGLAGRTVTGLAVEHGEGSLVFTTTTGDVGWGTYGDCCSETWFADVINLAALLNHPVLHVSETWTDDPDDGQRSRQEVDSVGVITITTVGGDCRIEWRNSSNGYYGGSVELIGGRDTYVEHDSMPTLLTPITHDWRAP